jgi:hypothetical protein
MLKEQQAFTYTNQPQNQNRQQVLARNKVIRPGLYPADEDNGEPNVPAYYTRPHTSARAYYPTTPKGRGVNAHPNQQINIPPRRSAQRRSQETEGIATVKPRRRIHPLAIAGIGAMVALLLWVGLTWACNKWTDTVNDWTYTQAFRTFSVDFAVGHNGDSKDHPSHFIVQNDKRKIVIIEFPADSPAKLIVYYGPVLLGDGQDKVPITISFQQDTQTGRVDMVLHVEGQNYLFTNNGTKFVQPASQ